MIPWMPDHVCCWAIVQQVCGKNGTMQSKLLLLKKITFFAEPLANWKLILAAACNKNGIS